MLFSVSLKFLANFDFSLLSQKCFKSLKILFIFKSSQPEVFCKKCALKNFAKFTGKHLCQSFFFNKFAGLKAALLKKDTLTQSFSSGFCEIFKNTFYIHVFYKKRNFLFLLLLILLLLLLFAVLQY